MPLAADPWGYLYGKSDSQKNSVDDHVKVGAILLASSLTWAPILETAALTIPEHSATVDSSSSPSVFPSPSACPSPSPKAPDDSAEIEAGDIFLEECQFEDAKAAFLRGLKSSNPLIVSGQSKPASDGRVALHANSGNGSQNEAGASG